MKIETMAITVEVEEIEKSRTILIVMIYVGCIALVTALLLLKINNIIKLDCPIRKYTGYQCPSCGMTRAFREVLNGNLSLAIKYNTYIMTTWIIPLVLTLKLSYEYIKQLKIKNTLVYLSLYAMTLVVYGIFRNIY